MVTPIDFITFALMAGLLVGVPLILLHVTAELYDE